MQVFGLLANVGVAVTCCAVLFSVLLVALVIWYWKNQPDMKTSATAPTPPIAASIEHPTAAAPATAPAPEAAPAAPAPEAAPAAPAPETAPEPPSADA